MSVVKEDRRGWLRNRQSWPQVLNRLLSAELWAALGEGQPRDGNQARAGWTPRFLLLLSVCIGWSGKRQLGERFAQGRHVATQVYPVGGELPISYQGFFKQLSKRGPDWVRSSVLTLRQKGPDYARSGWYRHNWVPFAVDGSRLDAPRTASNEEQLGSAGRSGTGPQAWVTLVAHLPTGLLWDWRQGPGTSSERHHLLDMIADLPERALVVADAGFVGYEVMRAMIHAGRPFLIRCGGNVTLLVDEPVGERALLRSRQGTRVWLWPDQQRRRRHPPLALRLIVLKRKARRIYLVTNVLSPMELPKRMAGEFYQARWGVEVTYRSLKQTMERRKLLARTPAHAQVELAANLLALFLLVLHGLLIFGVRVHCLSVASALRVLREAIEALRWGVRWMDFLAAFQQALQDDYHRLKPKAARNWPHKKTEKPPGPPMLCRLRAAQRGRLLSIVPEHCKTG